MTEKYILVNLSLCRLYVYESGVPVKDYPVGIGGIATPTPTGHFAVTKKIEAPEDAVVGTRCLRLSGNRCSIHGTDDPSSVGRLISCGCVRMYNQDIEELYAQVECNIPVVIIR